MKDIILPASLSLVMGLLTPGFAADAQKGWRREQKAQGRRPTCATYVVAAADSQSRRSVDPDYQCNGAKDDLTIQAAIDALPPRGGKVLLLDGTYAIEGSVALASNMILSGHGWGTILKLRDNVGVKWGILHYKPGGISGTVIRDLMVDGNRANNASGMVLGMNIHNSSDVKVTNVKVTGTNKIGMYFDNCTDCRIELCTATDFTLAGYYFAAGSKRCALLNSRAHGNRDDYGVRLTSVGAQHNEDIVVMGNTFRNSLVGVYIESNNRRIIVANNLCLDNAGSGVHVRTDPGDTPEHITVSQNNIANNGWHGIVLSRLHGGKICGNTICNNDYDGMRLSACDDCLVSNNVIEGNSQGADGKFSGIALAGSKRVHISGGIIRRGTGAKKQKYGVLIDADCRDCTVREADLHSSGTAGAMLDLSGKP